MNKIIKKITSRKFIVTAAIITAGIGAALKSANNEKVQIAGYVIAGAAAVAYMVIEGTVDKAAVQKETENIIDAVEGSTFAPFNLTPADIYDGTSSKEEK